MSSAKALESPEETVKRYWRRAAEQPEAKQFAKGEIKGMDEAMSKLRDNVRFRAQRQPETNYREELARAAGSAAG